MLSYRHAFHAGNHADLLKHWVLTLCLQYLKNKDKPFLYLDTHAGAGGYSLRDEKAGKTGEYQQGIERLWQAQAIPPVFDDYLQTVRAFNQNETITRYPGSPQIAAQLLRDEDRLCLAELHGSDYQLLQQQLGGDRRVRILHEDGFQQLKAQLPPASRRGLILIDPPYELKEDYQQLLEALKEGLKRFATGCYLVWYPLLSSSESQRFSTQLRNLPCEKWLDVALQVEAKPTGAGMYGSGMFVINPPYLLKEQLQQGLPWLTELLAVDEVACFRLDSQG